MFNEKILKNEEKAIFALRSLYKSYGYLPFKMSKFEEYDLYAKNKDFLISDEVITFTDRSGKLLALKPDVTLSIVKNTADRPETIQKLFYNENVYRVSKSSRSFRELMQVGLEALGNVDDYCVAEVLELACRSLRSISARCVLEISHLGLLQELIEGIGIPEKQKNQDQDRIIGRSGSPRAGVRSFCGGLFCAAFPGHRFFIQFIPLFFHADAMIMCVYGKKGKERCIRH